MEYEFHLQDPTCPSTVYLFEAIISAVRNAAEWRGMFAFASRGGVDALLADPEVVQFLGHGSMSLLVGIDAITNRGTLERLRELEATYQRMMVRVFWNRTAGLFHPKISHFTYADGRRSVIVGSGNLTPGGLRQNFEAFSVVRAGPRERLSLASWDQFLRDHAADIRAIDDAALERAALNVVRARARVREEPEPDAGPVPVAAPVEPGGAEETAPVTTTDVDRILVSSVPRAGGRWHQVHFNKEVIEQFFRVQPNSTQRVYLRECRLDGTFGDLEVRPCVLSERNLNHKIELGSHHGAAYPADGKPIAVFRELQARSFAYVLLMPGETGYRESAELLNRLPKAGRGDPRAITNLNELRRAWPASPLLTGVVVGAPEAAGPR